MPRHDDDDSSAEQHRLAAERVRAAGLEDRVQVLLRDYRDLEGQYDKLVSIEMIEPWGTSTWTTTFASAATGLAPDGDAPSGHHVADQHHEKHRASVDFIKEYIFPGSCLPSVTSMVTSATRTT